MARRDCAEAEEHRRGEVLERAKLTPSQRAVQLKADLKQNLPEDARCEVHATHS
jgi:hypothetical protein